MRKSDHRRDLNCPRVMFFCGDWSPWGHAHLEPLLSNGEIEIVGVVLATEARWKKFREALTGEKQAPSRGVIGWLKKLVRTLPRKYARSPRQATLDILSKNGIPVLLCDDVNSPENINIIGEYKADAMLGSAYPQIFGKRLLSLFPKGAFNSHPSLLPRCRGAHPVFWAIASGETKAGATIHYMTERIDEGDIAVQIEVGLLPTDSYSDLYTKLIDVVTQLVSQFTHFLTSPESKSIPQDSTKATYFRKDRHIHRRIFWSEMTADEINNLVRASDGKAYFWTSGMKVFVCQVTTFAENRNMTNNISVPAGTVVDSIDGCPIVAARKGFVLIRDTRIGRLKKLRLEIGQALL